MSLVCLLMLFGWARVQKTCVSPTASFFWCDGLVLVDFFFFVFFVVIVYGSLLKIMIAIFNEVRSYFSRLVFGVLLRIQYIYL